MHPDDPTMFEEELDSLENIDNDPWFLDDDSDEYESLEDRLAPLLINE